MLSILFFLAVLGVTICEGQSSMVFQWQFQNQVLSPQLPTCLPLAIVVKPFNATANNSSGVPPYFMISFPLGGTPITTPIGSDPDNLSWTVTHPAGSQLLLSVVDSTGGAGGSPPQLVIVALGQTTQCVVPADPNPTFTVRSNVTGPLETCQPWGITVSGGSPPYNLTLVETNSPVVTNVSIPFGFDRFTYPNRAEPNGVLVAAISDLEGRWAHGTPSVMTIGSSDTTCTGLVSSSGNSTIIDAADAAVNARVEGSKRRRQAITGVSVTLVSLLVIGCAILWYLRYRKRTMARRKRDSEQRARQYPDVPGTSQRVQDWVTFNTGEFSSQSTSSSNPIDRSRKGSVPIDPRVEPAPSEPDTEAPPYQEVEFIPPLRRRVLEEEIIAPGSSRVVPPLPSKIRRDRDGDIQNRVQTSLRLEQPRPHAAAGTSGLPPVRAASSSSSSAPTPSGMAAASASSTGTSGIGAGSGAIPGAEPTLPSRARKASAGFVMFPTRSVREVAGRPPAIGASNGNSTTQMPSGSDHRTRDRYSSSQGTMGEEGTLPPRYASGY